MSEASLEEELVDLATHLEVGDGEAAARAVAHRLGRGVGVTARTPWWRRPRTWVPLAVAVAATAVVASPAVGDWFGIRGVEVVERPAPATSTTTSAPPAGAALDLGRPSTMAEAAKVLGRFPILPSALGPPQAIWLDTRTPVPFVSFVFAGGPFVSEFDATLTPGPIVTKFIQPGGTVEELQIDGHPAMWIDGVHQIVLRARNGDLVPEGLRTSSSVLLVEAGDLTVRIETPEGREEAIRIARSLG